MDIPKIDAFTRGRDDLLQAFDPRYERTKLSEDDQKLADALKGTKGMTSYRLVDAPFVTQEEGGQGAVGQKDFSSLLKGQSFNLGFQSGGVHVGERSEAAPAVYVAQGMKQAESKRESMVIGQNTSNT
jgi:hypothetical protein